MLQPVLKPVNHFDSDSRFLSFVLNFGDAMVRFTVGLVMVCLKLFEKPMYRHHQLGNRRKF